MARRTSKPKKPTYKGKLLKTPIGNGHCTSAFQIGGEWAYEMTDILPVFAKHLKKRCKGGRRQNLVSITGDTGSGKSTLGIALAMAMDPEWDIDEGYIYEDEDLKDRVRRNLDGAIMLMDEGTVTINAHDHNKKEVKQIGVIFDTMRSLGWTVFICSPRLSQISKTVRDVHIAYLIRIPRTGRMNIYYPKRGEFKSGIYWQLVARGPFPDIDGDVAKKYKAIKRQRQEAYLSQFSGKKETAEEEEVYIIGD